MLDKAGLELVCSEQEIGIRAEVTCSWGTSQIFLQEELSIPQSTTCHLPAAKPNQRLIHENSIEIPTEWQPSPAGSLITPPSLGTGSNCWPYFEVWMLVACLTAILYIRAVRLLLHCAVTQCVQAKRNASFWGCTLCFLITSCYFSKFYSNECSLCLVNYVI